MHRTSADNFRTDLRLNRETRGDGRIAVVHCNGVATRAFHKYHVVAIFCSLLPTIGIDERKLSNSSKNEVYAFFVDICIDLSLGPRRL